MTLSGLETAIKQRVYGVVHEGQSVNEEVLSQQWFSVPAVRAGQSVRKMWLKRNYYKEEATCVADRGDRVGKAKVSGRLRSIETSEAE